MKYSLAMLMVCGLILTGCSLFKPYHMDIPQGNQLTPEQTATLHTGMTKEQVIHLLGSPVQTNALDANRMDYVYTMQKNGGPIEEKQLSLFFDHNVLTRIEKKNAILQQD